MDISQVLDHLEIDLLDKVDELSNKDYCTFWASIKEFEVAKLQRATAAPITHDDREITITIINSKEDLDLGDVSIVETDI